MREEEKPTTVFDGGKSDMISHVNQRDSVVPLKVISRNLALAAIVYSY